jgi:glutamate dehydrogenase/leucine dehydrogenase
MLQTPADHFLQTIAHSDPCAATTAAFTYGNKAPDTASGCCRAVSSNRIEFFGRSQLRGSIAVIRGMFHVGNKTVQLADKIANRFAALSRQNEQHLAQRSAATPMG